MTDLANQANVDTEDVQDYRMRLPALVEYRAAATRRRATAFCDAPEYVVGIPVMPLTPRTYSMLAAVGSHFVWGGQPTEGDVRNYIWFHSRDWSHIGIPGWQRKKARALRPLVRQLVNPVRRAMGFPLEIGRYGATLALAIVDIHGLIVDAFADSPGPAGKGGEAVATLEAQMVNIFAQEYHWSADVTRNVPIRQLFQFLRCLRSGRGEDIADRGEQQILSAHLRRRQELLDKKKNLNG